jgi:hypothetical protein
MKEYKLITMSRLKKCLEYIDWQILPYGCNTWRIVDNEGNKTSMVLNYDYNIDEEDNIVRKMELELFKKAFTGKAYFTISSIELREKPRFVVLKNEAGSISLYNHQKDKN